MNDNLPVERKSLPKPHPDERTIQEKYHDSLITIMLLREEVLKEKKYVEESKKIITNYISSFSDGNVNAARFNTQFSQLLASHNKYNNNLKK